MTTASRRHFIRSLGALAAAPVLPAVAQAPAGAWPQRPIELIVPFAAGGAPTCWHARWPRWRASTCRRT